MTKKSAKIVFFGNERLATGVTTSAPTLRALIKAGYEIKAVVSNYEPGRSRNARDLEINQVAGDNGIPVLLPAKPGDIVEQLKNYGAQVGILAAYGKIVPTSVIDLFPSGIINLHPSLLPLHRGPTPIESVILSGENKTGVSIMKLVSAMDAGPVYGYSELDLSGKETKQSLATSLLDIGSSLLLELLPGILAGDIAAQPQDEKRATYDNLITKNDGIIDWSKPASVLEREIRAYQKWPNSSTNLAGIDVILTSAEVSDDSGQPGVLAVSDGQLAVYCGEGSLVISSLKPAGKNEMPAQAFLAGYGNRLK